MIKIRHSKNCCGCSACIDICPRNCITQIIDKDGYIKPSVDKTLCVDCHLCEKVCPEINTIHLSFERRTLYSAYHKDEEIRSKGSSGSVFAALAQYVFSNNGVVYGAAFDSHLKLKHVKAENMEELRPLMRSKYLQSNTEGLYNAIKEELKNGKQVLFVGTPCQTNAVFNFLSPILRENLLLVDFICHGVPSQNFFDKSLHNIEKKDQVKILNISFHTKYKGLYHSYEIQYVDKDGNIGTRRGPYTAFPFYRAFKSYITFRDSCYHCKHVGEDRVSDLTIGDFWCIRSVSPNISPEEFAKGFSEVVVNSPKGEHLIERIRKYMVLQQFDIKYAGYANPSYLQCVKEGKKKFLFRFLNRFFPYSIVEKVLFHKK